MHRAPSFLVLGVTGSFLILIMDTAVAAALFDSRRSQIHSVTSLLAIPLADFSSANDAITKHATKAAAARQKRAASVSTVGTATEEGTDGSSDAMSSDDETDTEADARPQTPDVTVRKQPFWQKPFVRRTPAKPAVVLTDSTAKTSPPQALPDASDVDASSVAPAPAPETVEAAVATSPDKSDADVARSQAELDQKVVSELLRTMNGLYFSFDLDVTRSYQRKHDLIVNSAGSSPQASPSAFLEPQANLPLWRRADRRFWWNRHLTRPFVEAGVSPKCYNVSVALLTMPAAVAPPTRPGFAAGLRPPGCGITTHATLLNNHRRHSQTRRHASCLTGSHHRLPTERRTPGSAVSATRRQSGRRRRKLCRD